MLKVDEGNILLSNTGRFYNNLVSNTDIVVVVVVLVEVEVVAE
jgi:hypothetical protein